MNRSVKVYSRDSQWNLEFLEENGGTVHTRVYPAYTPLFNIVPDIVVWITTANLPR